MKTEKSLILPKSLKSTELNYFFGEEKLLIKFAFESTKDENNNALYDIEIKKVNTIDHKFSPDLDKKIEWNSQELSEQIKICLIDLIKNHFMNELI